MACRVVFTELAVEDLEGICRYVEHDDPESARRLCEGLYELALSVGRNPFIGRMTPEYGDPAIRDIVRGKYRIVYTVNTSTETIQIIRLWHGARGYLPRKSGRQQPGGDEPPFRAPVSDGP